MIYFIKNEGVEKVKIGIVGGGSVGLLCAYYLSKHHDVTVITRRKEQADAISKNGIHFTKDKCLDISICKASDKIDSTFDLFIVSVKQHHLVKVLPMLEKLPETAILFLQNGMAHISELKHWNVKHHLFVGSVEHGALRTGDYSIEHTGEGKIRWSAFRTTTKNELLQLEKNTSEAFPFQYEDNWYQMLAEKLLVNACINPLTALMRVKNGELIHTPYLTFMRLVFEEAITILKLNNKDEVWKKVLLICEKTQHNISSMLKDIMSSRETEIDAILGFLLKESEDKGYEVPHLAFLYRSVKALDKNEDKIF